MTDWEPATEAEAALRDALRSGDQELYFRILSRIDLLLPVSADVLAGRAQIGWGTWTSGGRTHILAFTSPEAMSACLAEHAGTMLSYAQLVRGAQGYDAGEIEASELIKPHIHHLRQKLEPDSSIPRYILNVRGKGYLLSPFGEEGLATSRSAHVNSPTATRMR